MHRVSLADLVLDNEVIGFCPILAGGGAVFDFTIFFDEAAVSSAVILRRLLSVFVTRGVAVLPLPGMPASLDLS